MQITTINRRSLAQINAHLLDVIRHAPFCAGASLIRVVGARTIEPGEAVGNDRPRVTRDGIMCGIFGYVGEPIDLGQTLLEALRILEYRGYDSWGIGIAHGPEISVDKHVGRINGARMNLPPSGLEFGHTRWATHGGVTDANAHPHLDCTGHLAVIHNGIVENHRDLRAALSNSGHTFHSDTDSEVIPHLLEDALARGAPLAAALASTFAKLEGLNAVIAIDARTREMVAAKSVSPLVVGLGPRGAVIASDALALHGHADRVVYLEDDQLIHLCRDGIALYDRRSLAEITPELLPLPEPVLGAELGVFPHFMVKEIAEQPCVLAHQATASLSHVETLASAIRQADHIFLIGCGSAAYAAQTGAYLFSHVARRQVHFVVGSEFTGYEHILTSQSLVVALSQRGETADIISAMLLARRHGAKLGAIVNVEQSTLDRLVDLRVPLLAGPEQCVLATKSYTAQVAALLLTAHAVIGSHEEGKRLVQRTAATIDQMLASTWVDQVHIVAREISQADHLFVIGRGLNYPTALEAALKIKEVTYIHAEGFAGGELKHGVIALIEPGTPCLVIAPSDETHRDILSGAAELKSRGGWIIGVGAEDDPVFDVHLPIPELGDASPIANTVVAQLLSYHMALLRGNDPDRPRNLAKSVTVK